MITISINPQTPAHMAIIAEALIALLGQDAPAAPVATQEPAPAEETPAKRTRRTKEEMAAAQAPKPVDAPSGATVPAGPTSTTTDTKSTTEAPMAITLEEVRAKLAALSQGGKTTAVKELIGSFGVGKLTDLKVEQYAAVLEKAEAL